jgi:hypothetical protein
MMISKISLKDIHNGINLIDLGASGDASKYWENLVPLINLYGFDRTNWSAHA